MSENRARRDTTLDALEALHKDVERRSFSLPTFSLSPFVIGWWNYIKFGVCLFLDLLLLPVNAIIFLRNLFSRQVALPFGPRVAIGSTPLTGFGEERHPRSHSR